MCRVTVNCHCHTGSGGLLGPAALGLLAVAAAPAVVAALHLVADLLTAVVVGVVAAVGVVVAGWIVKAVAVAAVEEWSLRRHNERMADRYPHLRGQLGRHHRPGAAAVPAVDPARGVDGWAIYPTPREQLAGRGRDGRAG